METNGSLTAEEVVVTALKVSGYFNRKRLQISPGDISVETCTVKSSPRGRSRLSLSLLRIVGVLYVGKHGKSTSVVS